ncbi:MAG: undecaprenyl/decaprenyl-phosphate alpha-N-acetylglucosaminyl 1-phosphate transferase [Oscillospiraceae bacterium]|nr:undecaprenyl/decaprenyl-phosphate alpha-N-acetylglucosaminyl 1-phosphate transferase [Oscillospiraceae bacterium]
MWGDIAIAFLLALITAFVFTPYSIKLAKKVGAVDMPNDERKINKTPMPRLGGIAVIIGFIVSMSYLVIVMSIEGKFDLASNYQMLCGFLLGAFILGIVCYFDDIHNVSPLVKLLAQIIAASIAVWAGVRIGNLNIPFLYKVGLNGAFSTILTICWIVGVTNAINLIDGLDGLSSGIAIISSVSLLIIFTLNGSPLIAILLITALLGSLVGFLPFNFNPAKTFMGDVGSNFLGFSLAIISILGVAKTYTLIVIVAPLIVLALPVFDTLWAIFRRVIKERSFKAIIKPDAGHLHHRIMKKGFTQKQAVFILYGISAGLGMFAVILLESGFWKAISFLLIVAAVIAIGYNSLIKNKEKI